MSKQPRLVTALIAAVGAVGLVFTLDSGVAPAEKDPQASASGIRKFCKKHPRRPRCRRLRLTLTWDDNANIDLHVWDNNLNHASPFQRFAIPRAFHIGDTGVDPEKFFDRRFTPRRQFNFGVCLKQEPAFDPTVYTITYVRADGQVVSDTDELFDEGQSILYVFPGVTDPDPANTGAWCPP